MLSTTTRVVIGLIGTLMVLAGLGLVGTGSLAGTGLWLTVIGAGIVVAVVIERQRYRSEDADRTFEPIGPGGGEIKEYTSLLEDTRRQALDRLVKNATLMGANAVVSMRFDSSGLAGTMSEIVAYGTAVVIEPDSTAPQTTE